MRNDDSVVLPSSFQFFLANRNFSDPKAILRRSPFENRFHTMLDRASSFVYQNFLGWKKKTIRDVFPVFPSTPFNLQNELRTSLLWTVFGNIKHFSILSLRTLRVLADRIFKISSPFFLFDKTRNREFFMNGIA